MDINKLNSKQRKLYFMLEEFVNEEDLSKFSRVLNDKRFTNGVCMSSWFNYHKPHIMNNTDPLSLKAQAQFQAYNENKNEIIEEKEYKIKLKEFYLDDNEDKFIRNSKILFKDRTHKGIWFNDFMDKILSSSDKLSLKVKKQYYTFSKNISKEEKDSFKEKITEFAYEKDMKKFKRNGGILFFDGTSKDRWFDAYKYKILDSADSLSLIIQEQYKEFEYRYVNDETMNVMFEDSKPNNGNCYVKTRSKN